MRILEFFKLLWISMILIGGIVVGAFFRFPFETSKELFYDPPAYETGEIFKLCSCPESLPTSYQTPSTPFKPQPTPPPFVPAYPSISSFSGRYLNCTDVLPEQFITQHGLYYVSHNHIPANQMFKCDETITYTTHTEFNFLQNLIQLLPRWRGPVSVALHAPGSDYDVALTVIQYLRECSPVASLVRELVTFHIYFHRQHIPESFSELKWADFAESSLHCEELDFEAFFASDFISYRKQNKLPYPINVGRNIAKDAATTHFVLPSDIELFPSENMIPHFLEMLRQQPELIPWGPNLNSVFVLPVFEITENVSADKVPADKKVLRRFFGAQLANYFHFKFTKSFHAFPGHQTWMARRSPVGENRLSIVSSSKRTNPDWEPFYIGLRSVPFWDERLTWRQRNKIAQASVLCLLDYTFHILDDAFLIHRPGFKIIDEAGTEKEFPVTKKLFRSTIEPEMYRLYGENTICYPKKIIPTTAPAL